MSERAVLPPSDPGWWRTAVIYQVYGRSFCDADGDGVGDLAGVRAKLPYLRDLGVDAVWFTPWYPSPMADGGYDVADYRNIDPAFGTLQDAEELIREALQHGLRTIIDVVPNHVSDQHPWFQAALASPPASPERSRFWFRPGRGDGSVMPTEWTSSFGGSTWSRTTDGDGTPGEWYLHLFSAHQPDLNWENPQVREEHEEILRFWFARGVSGIRIDSAAFLVKDPTFPEVSLTQADGEHPFTDRDELHEIYRSWRALADGYPGDRVLVGEIWLDSAERFGRYLRSDELHTAFNFDFMSRAWNPKELRESIETTVTLHDSLGAPATWVLSNHDVTRPVTRYGRADTSFSFAAKRFGTPTDLELGLRRARAAALLAAALPGSLYIFQGDELGLPEVEDLPLEVLQDPMHERSGGVDPGRDGCRVPLPWAADGPALGFSPRHATREPWLPQPRSWASLSVEAQERDRDSTLSLYRSALRIRRLDPDLRDARFSWLELGDGVLAFRRGRRFACITNLSDAPIALPLDGVVVLVSAPLTDGLLAPDATAWLHLLTG